VSVYPPDQYNRMKFIEALESEEDMVRTLEHERKHRAYLSRTKSNSLPTDTLRATRPPARSVRAEPGGDVTTKPQ
jgi:hypothetical protein